MHDKRGFVREDKHVDRQQPLITNPIGQLVPEIKCTLEHVCPLTGAYNAPYCVVHPSKTPHPLHQCTCALPNT